MGRRALALAFLVAAGCFAGCNKGDLTEPAAVRQKLQSLADAAITYAHRQHSPPLFPMSSSDWSPRGRLCDGGKLLAADPQEWEAPPWKELGFSLPGRSAYQFRVMRAGSASRETLLVEARGDRNCNGVASHFTITVDAQLVARPIQVEREDE